MADSFGDPGDDPFQTPSVNQELPMPPAVGDPRAGQPYPPLVRDQPRSGGNSLAVAVILGLALVAVAAIVGAGYLVANGISASAGSSADGDIGPAPYPDEITDLERLTAVPGETFTDSLQGLVAGKDIAPGIYIAPEAVHMSADTSPYCSWSVRENPADENSGFRVRGSVDGGTAMLLAPEGYTVSATATCGTWEAVDPATLFDEPAGSTIGSEIHVVGYDVKPGLYLSDGPVAKDADCYVYVNPNFGFEGPDTKGGFFYGEVGTLRLEVEAGDFVIARGCPSFEWADPQTAFSADAGAKSVNIGTWLVGVDVQPGTYRGPADPDARFGYCYAQVWDEKADWGSSDPVEEVGYAPDKEPVTFTAELGHVIHINDCEPWELVEP